MAELTTGNITVVTLYVYAGTWSLSEADLTVGHSCSGRRGPWPWRPPGVGPARRTMEVAFVASCVPLPFSYYIIGLM